MGDDDSWKRHSSWDFLTTWDSSVGQRDLFKTVRSPQGLLASSSRYLVLGKGSQGHHEPSKFQLPQTLKLYLPSKYHGPLTPSRRYFNWEKTATWCALKLTLWYVHRLTNMYHAKLTINHSPCALFHSAPLCPPAWQPCWRWTPLLPLRCTAQCCYSQFYCSAWSLRNYFLSHLWNFVPQPLLITILFPRRWLFSYSAYKEYMLHYFDHSQ